MPDPRDHRGQPKPWNETDDAIAADHVGPDLSTSDPYDDELVGDPSSPQPEEEALHVVQEP